MTGRLGACVLVLWALLGVAAAEGPPTTLTGRVSDVLGRPIADARVYVLAKTGEREETRTNKHGRYAVKLSRGGAYGVVIAVDEVHTYRTVLIEAQKSTTLDVEVELDVAGGEVIKIVDRKLPAPAVKPKPTTDSRKSLPYSEEAVERDAWAKAWVLLDVNESGMVTRLKLLKAPGFDLDKIAIEEAFKLRFAPARDAAGRPMRTYVVWAMEWPSWGWLAQGNGTTGGKPNDTNAVHGWSMNHRERELATANWARPSAVAFPHALERVPCAGSGPLNLDLRNRAYRDCSGYDLGEADALPWITRDTVDVAVAEIAKTRAALIEIPGEPPSRIPDVIASVVTGGLVVAMIASYRQFGKYDERVRELGWQRPIDWDANRQAIQGRDRWTKISLGMSAAAIISGAVTLFLWNRDAPPSSFSVQPSKHGGTASLSVSF
jgi:hypothetical protein